MPMPDNAPPSIINVELASGTVPVLADQLNVSLKVLKVAIHWAAASSAGLPLWMTPVPVKVSVDAVWAD